MLTPGSGGADVAQARLVHPSANYVLDAAHDSPIRIVNGPDGALWFVETTSNSIGRITTSGAVSYFSIPFTDSDPTDLTVGSDGNIWFADDGAEMIGKLTPAGTFTGYAIPTVSAGACGIGVGADGNVWFTESFANKIGKITPAGTITEYTVSSRGDVSCDLNAASDGNIWFARPEGVGKITPAGTETFFPIVSLASLHFMLDWTIGPDGAVWIVDANLPGGTQLHRVDVTGNVQSTTMDRDMGPITTGPNGNLWFGTADGVFQMAPGSDLSTQVQLDVDPAGVYDIITGPDGNVWTARGGSITKISPTAIEVADGPGGGAGGAPKPPPSNIFTLGKFTSGATGSLIITVPGPGKLTAGPPATGSASAKKKKKKAPVLVAKSSKTVVAAGSVKLPVKLSSAGKKQLKKKKTLTVKVKIAFKPNGGTASSKTVKVTFKAKKKQ